MTPYAKKVVACINALGEKAAQTVYELAVEEVGPEDAGLRVHMKHISAALSVAMVEMFKYECKEEVTETPGNTPAVVASVPETTPVDTPIRREFPPYIRRIK